VRVLVDTPIWSLALRRKTSDLSVQEECLERELAELIREGRACIIGPIRQEILSGIRNAKAFERLRERLGHFPDETLGSVDFEQAARFFNECRAQGITGSPTDLLICAVAHRLDLAVFTTDNDFPRYAEHLPVRLHAPRQASSRP